MNYIRHFSFVLIIFLCNNRMFAQTNTSTQTPKSLNGNVTICNMVQGGNVQHVAEDAPIVLFIIDSVSNQKVQLVFSKEVRKKFSYDPQKQLPDHRVCVSGKITDQNGSPSIIITSEKQIKTSNLTFEKK